jgi:hypothetical protein
MKKKVLIVFKYPHAWNENVINKFSNYYDIIHLYISEYKNLNFKEVIKNINNIIKSKNIDITVFDPDYFKFINLFFIEQIISKKKVLMIGDDIGLHEFHSITASKCDLVLNSDPMAVLKYQEKGYDSKFFQFEFAQLKNNSNIRKEINVLFYGHLTPDRKSYLDYIKKEGIEVKNVSHENNTVGIPKDELLNLIEKSKIVLNFSKTRTTFVQNLESENIYKYHYQLKGKMIVAGLKGTMCVSEYSPGQELLFGNKAAPMFYTKEECVTILKKFLSDESLLLDSTNKFAKKVRDICEDDKNFDPIYDFLEKPSKKKIELIKIPYWYLRIAAKQIMLRNLSLSTLIKNLSQINIIFSIIKKSSILTKFLIITETIINIIWYSLTLTIKNKKL